MARIKIRGRREELTLDNERALKLKRRKFGLDNVEKAKPNDGVDLGIWAGEYGQIVSIEIETASVTPASRQQERMDAEEQAEKEAWAKLTPEEKASRIARFKLSYSVRLNDFTAEPPAKVLKELNKRLIEFFTEDSEAPHYPQELVEDLLPPKTGTQSLAERMRVTEENLAPDRKCIQCGNQLPPNVAEYCSGSCMLDARNGKVSTK